MVLPPGPYGGLIIKLNRASGRPFTSDPSARPPGQTGAAGNTERVQGPVLFCALVRVDLPDCAVRHNELWFASSNLQYSRNRM